MKKTFIACLLATSVLLTACYVPTNNVDFSDAVNDLDNVSQAESQYYDNLGNSLTERLKEALSDISPFLNNDSPNIKSDISEYEDNGYRGAYSALYGQMPDYNGKGYVVLNDNVPLFSQQELQQRDFIEYSELDMLGRAGEASAMVSARTLPVNERSDISEIHPSGWHQLYVDNEPVANRCHLLGYQLCGISKSCDTINNLIYGTRDFNAGDEGMLPFENMLASYIRETTKYDKEGNKTSDRVLFRVTPLYPSDTALTASGVIMEAMSVTNPEGLCFCVYVFNIQKGIAIDYETGEIKDMNIAEKDVYGEYILNQNSLKFHKESCELAKEISEKNKEYYTGSRQHLIENSYKPCGFCNP